MSVAETLLAPADAVRSAVLRLAAPLVAPFFTDRRRRVLWVGLLSVGAAFLVTGLAPLWSLALGPVLLGVPHLVSDVRYLVVRPGLHRHVGPFALVVLPLVATSFGAGPVVGLLAVLPAVLLGPRRASWWALGVALGLWAVLSVLAYRFDYGFSLAFLHLHNVVALGLWWAFTPRRWSMAWVPLSAIGGSIAILAGVLDPLLDLSGGWSAPWTGTSLSEFVNSITPEMDATLAGRLVLSFCFLQSVHYAVWLRLVPDDGRPRVAPRTFAASWNALREDLGLPLLLVVGGLALAIAAWGLVSLPQARLGYLQLAAFHGYLELAIAARWFVHGRLT